MKMSKRMKKALSLLLAVVLVMTTFVALPITSEAAESPLKVEGKYAPVWADPDNVLDQTKVDAFNNGTNKTGILGGIAPFVRSTSSDNYYWFFPSNADLSALTVWAPTGQTLSINGYVIQSGDTTDAFASINEGGTTIDVPVVVGNTSYTVTAIKSGDVGSVFIDTNSGSIKTITNSSDHSTSEAGTIMVVRPDGTVDYMGEMTKMSGRGNGTWGTGNVKNPYNVKLATSTSLLGMGSAKKWCLLANSGDDTLIKNQLSYDFAKYIGVKYQPSCKPVDLYVNQQYYGSYQLAEKVEIKSNRININDAYENLEIANGTADPTTGAITPADLTGTSVYTENKTTSGSGFLQRDFTGHTVGAKHYSTSLQDPDDLTGGYLYELEISKRWYEENAGFCAYNRQGWVMKSTDYASRNMAYYSYNLLYALGGAIYNGGVVPSESTTTSCSSLSSAQLYGATSCTNPAPAAEYQGKTWDELLDSDSAVIYYWTQEYFKNMDSSTSSTYFYKDSDSVDSKLYAGPVWDMDNSMGYNDSGSRWGYSWTSSDGWYTKFVRIYRWRTDDSSTTYSTDAQSPYSFYAALANNCTDFWTSAEARWYNTIRPATLILTGAEVDSTGTLKSTAEYTATVEKSGKMNSLRHDLSDYNAASIASGLNTWFTARTEWIDNQIPKRSLNSAVVRSLSNQLYTGAPIIPSYIVSYSGVDLTEGVDYTARYTNNTNASSSARVTLTGAGYYTGSKQSTFRILPNTLSTATVSIPDSSYIDTELKATVTDAYGNELVGGVTYQWMRDGVAISGATSDTYMTTSADAGCDITLSVTGDGSNVTDSAVSNTCEVATGGKPQGYQRTIAAWDYSYSTDPTALVDSGNYTYMATSGENMATSSLGASVTASSRSEIKWSSSSDIYKTDGVGDQVPIIGTSKTNGIAWGAYPYFETSVSTLGYEDIKFSGRVGATNKGPRDWKLQYSLDGVNFTDIANTTYTLFANKTMYPAFDEVSLPAECANQSRVYIRMTVASDIAISGIAIVNSLSGDAAVNNVAVTGVSTAVVTELNAPSFSTNTSLYNTDTATITDNNGGADVYYSTDGTNYSLYTGAFNPFDSATAAYGDTVTVSAYSYFNEIQSDTATQTYTFRGVDINDFIYEDYSTDVISGAVPSTGGVYGESGKMTAYADGTTQYVPYWKASNASFVVSPDDGVYWSEDSGFTYQVSTAGYSNIRFSCQGYTTAQGPKSVTLQYSTDGVTFYNVRSNVVLPANRMLEDVIVDAQLPSACENLQKVYIRLATTENLTNEGNTLHNNQAKGNLYINNVIVSGDDDGTYKMPYTNKSTNYFGASGVINYISPDGMPMKYVVLDSTGSIVQNGIVPETGIQLSTVRGFDETRQDAYTVMVEVEEDENESVVNTATYYYKGDTVVKFNYNSTTKLFEDYISSDGYTLSSTSGANEGALSMYPNGSYPAPLSYTGTYGVKVAYDAENPFSGNKNHRDNPNASDIGYWSIETSTAGFKNLTLSLEQLSSNNGPRDWGIAYSTDGSNYTYVANSNSRSISNDASSDTVETYSNLPLPSACDNQQYLYLMIFINGGEAVNGDELELITKGNIGINKIELSGTPAYKNVAFSATVLETKTAQSGSIGVGGADVYVNGRLSGTTNNNGVAQISVPMNYDCTVSVKGSGILDRDYSLSGTYNSSSLNVPVLIFDVNEDGIINAKDYAVMNKDSKYNASKQYFANFINTDTSTFTYPE